MNKATTLKEDGTKEFKDGNYIAAAELYKKAAKLICWHSLSDEDVDMYIKCWGNASMCYVKTKSWSDAIDCCNRVFNKFPDKAKTNIKLLYRRGLAKMHEGEWKDAKMDLLAAYELDSKNKDVHRAIKDLKEKVAESKKKEQSQFEGIFGKLSVYDDKSFNILLVATSKGDELINFPDTVLATIAEYMTKTERAITAVAMTASSSSWEKSNWQKEPSEASKIIIAAKPLKEIKVEYGSTFTYQHRQQQRARQKSYQWDFFDLEDITTMLAARLKDADIGALLVCIDAVKTIKRLKIKDCVRITGSGLEPLRGSTVIEQIDLSLAGSSTTSNESSELFYPPALSEAVVVPILDSIIEDDRSVLKHVQLPKKWRLEANTVLTQFLVRYNRFLNGRELTCCNKHRYNEPPCGATCNCADEDPWVPREGLHYGIQQHSCYECNKQYCGEHKWMVEHVCEICEKVCFHFHVLLV